MNETPGKLLAADEPAPVTVRNESCPSPFLIVADHAGNFVPRALGRLGLPEAELERHIAWDIGIAAVGRLLADRLDATLVQQNYSRLVIDCNRVPESETSIPEISELTPVPGNIGLSEWQKAARAHEIFWPYQDRIESEFERRRLSGRPVVPIAMHSFTPVFKGVLRPWLLAHRCRQGAIHPISWRRRHRVLPGRCLTLGQGELDGARRRLPQQVPMPNLVRGRLPCVGDTIGSSL
jgi:predicted N-formylglutamate amidohydrolase